MNYLLAMKKILLATTLLSIAMSENILVSKIFFIIFFQYIIQTHNCFIENKDILFRKSILKSASKSVVFNNNYLKKKIYDF